MIYMMMRLDLSLVQFSVSELAGFKNIYMSIYEEKKCIKSLVPLTDRGRGVKDFAECPAKNASCFFYVLS